MQRSYRDIDRLVKIGLKKNGYPDADSYSHSQIVSVIENSFQNIARANPMYRDNPDFAYQYAKLQILTVFDISQEEFDSYMSKRC